MVQQGTGPAVSDGHRLLFPVDAEHAVARPVVLRVLLDRDMESLGIGARMLDHGVGDRLGESAFLLPGPAFPQMNSHERH